MRTILVTGGAGFIGSNFLNKYVPLCLDIHFVNVDLLTYAANKDCIASLEEYTNYTFEQADIRDIDLLTKIVASYEVDDIIHFAAESHVDNSITGPLVFSATNTIGTHNLLEVHRQYCKGRFHYISTDEVYGDIVAPALFTESSSLCPSSPYSASKAAGDLMVQAYGRTYGIDYVITRSSNNYGPYQHTEKLIPHFIHLLLQGKPVTLYGNGENIRDWIYVEDNCDAVWTVFTKASSGEIYNIGGSNELSNIEVTKKLLEYMGKDESYISFVQDRLGHDERYALDNTKIRHHLGWSPQVSFEDGLAKTISFYIS